MNKFKWSVLFFVPLMASVSAFAGHGGYGGGIGAKVPLLLVALAFGYWALTLSEKQKKPLDLLGRIIGGLIILVSVGGLLCAAAFGYCKWRGSCSKDKVCEYKSAKSCKYHKANDSSLETPQK